MKTRLLTLPEIGMIAGTRMALGAGLGLLIGSRLDENARRGAGWALVAIGAVSTIPLLTAPRKAEFENLHPRRSRAPTLVENDRRPSAISSTGRGLIRRNYWWLLSESN
jgi:hypothetical protein